MKVRDIVQNKAKTCYGDTSLAEAAAIMLEHDYGILPVVESMTGKLCGVITDRDIAMGGLTQARPLDSIPVRHCCSRDIHTCTLDDELEVVHDKMRRNRIRRIPVINHEQRVVGLVSLDDLAMLTCLKPTRSAMTDLSLTLGAVCRAKAEKMMDVGLE